MILSFCISASPRLIFLVQTTVVTSAYSMLVSGLQVCVGNKSHLPQDTFPNGFSSFHCLLELRHLSLSGTSTIKLLGVSSLLHWSLPMCLQFCTPPETHSTDLSLEVMVVIETMPLFRGTSRVRGLRNDLVLRGS